MIEEDVIDSGGFDSDDEDFASLFASQDKASSGRLEPGKKVSGAIIAVTGDNVFIDVGAKVDGVMEYKEILDVEGKQISGIGDTVEAWVVAVSTQEVRLSRSMSGGGAAAMEDARDAGVPVEGKVLEVCKGGYNVSVLGKTAFCPGSQMGIGSLDDAQSLVGRVLQFLIMRIESGGRNIVVSHRAFLDRERQENQDRVLADLKEGDFVEGKVTRILPFGVFVELAPGVEGMIHLSELAWFRVEAAEDIVSPDTLVRAKVLSITQDNKGRPRISLSRKQAEDDPWLHAQQQFPVGTTVNAIVESRSKFGLFVTLAPGITGLLPTSVIKNAKNAGEYGKLDKGDAVVLIVQHMDSASRRVSLAPESSQDSVASDDKSWKQHAATEASDDNSIMAQALRKAMQEK